MLSITKKKEKRRLSKRTDQESTKTENVFTCIHTETPPCSPISLQTPFLKSRCTQYSPFLKKDLLEVPQPHIIFPFPDFQRVFPVNLHTFQCSRHVQRSIMIVQSYLLIGMILLREEFGRGAGIVVFHIYSCQEVSSASVREGMTCS